MHILNVLFVSVQCGDYKIGSSTIVRFVFYVCGISFDWTFSLPTSDRQIWHFDLPVCVYVYLLSPLSRGHGVNHVRPI